LLSANVQEEKTPDSALPRPELPPTTTYAFQLDLYEGSELPISLSKEKFQVELVVGNRLLWTSQTQHANRPDSKGAARWYAVADVSVPNLPLDLAQCPDVFIYLVVDKISGNERICFSRLSFASLMAQGWGAGPRWIDLQECEDVNGLDADEFPGCLLLALRVATATNKPAKLEPGSRPFLNDDEKGKTPGQVPQIGNMVVQLVSARNLPALDTRGIFRSKSSDPMVELFVNPVTQRSSVKKRNLNPDWNEVTATPLLT